ncbi:hypothetical protein JA1_000127 [Spathaspora sp. JA1]|nr:hypothetical protein JA1_000127 [Spathaspora sp. JA1]
MDTIIYKLEENQLTPSEETFDYIDLNECTCASCNHWKTQLHKRQSLFLIVGILIPLIWIYNIIQIVFGLYFRNHNPRSICQYVQVFKRMEHLSSNVAIDDGYVDNHTKTRNEMLTGLGHTCLAIIIYVLFVFMFAIGSADFVRTEHYRTN